MAQLRCVQRKKWKVSDESDEIGRGGDTLQSV